MSLESRVSITDTIIGIEIEIDTGFVGVAVGVRADLVAVAAEVKHAAIMFAVAIVIIRRKSIKIGQVGGWTARLDVGVRCTDVCAPIEQGRCLKEI